MFLNFFKLLSKFICVNILIIIIVLWSHSQVTIEFIVKTTNPILERSLYIFNFFIYYLDYVQSDCFLFSLVCLYHCKGSSFTKLKFNNFNKMIICCNFNIEVFILVDLTYLSWFDQPTLAFRNDLPFKIITRLH